MTAPISTGFRRALCAKGHDFTASGKTRPGGRPGIHPRHKANQISLGFSPCGMLFKLFAGSVAFFRKLFGRANSAQNAIRALYAAEKLIRAVGRGFIPGIKSIQSMRDSAPEVCFSSFPPGILSFSAACLTPAACISGLSSPNPLHFERRPA